MMPWYIQSHLLKEQFEAEIFSNGNFLLTQKSVGSYNAACSKQKRGRHSIMPSKNHCVDDGFVNEITNFGKIRNV